MSSALFPLKMHGLAYPERLVEPLGTLDDWAAHVTSPLHRRLRSLVPGQARFVAMVAEAGAQCESVDHVDLAGMAHLVRDQLVREGFVDGVVAQSFALVREAARRTIQQRHFDVQLLGGWVMLRGLVAEMETGEGKTLTATLPACTAALAGIPVHIVTVNDYLAARDAELMGPIYHALGLTVGVIVHGMDPEARRAAYACDVTYCTNKELVFDYLKDRLLVGHHASRAHLQLERLSGPQARAHGLLLRGLHYAIVDEADSVLVDEARTPLIIAGRGADTSEQLVYTQALTVARHLTPGKDFHVESREQRIRLSASGEQRVAELTRSYGAMWTGRSRRESLLRQALSALHLFQRDHNYLLHDAKVQIIDEYTGRVMPDRSWERGLQQMIETKEGCPLSDRQDTLARISYQRFFRRYLRLAGMTGTAREVAAELWTVYRLGVVRVPTNKLVCRRDVGERVFATLDEKWAAVVESIQVVHREGRPVLVGTRSVAASERLSRLLAAAGLPHQVLNARQDEAESAIVAVAGEPGRITVATNMAGRGTDIKLDPEVIARGGLHVIATERHDAGRIDRQLFGRCGRQGDPGTFEVLVSLEDELVLVHGQRWIPFVATAVCTGWRGAGRMLTLQAQRAAERLHRRIRQAVLKMDDHLESSLAFTGRPE